MSKTWSDFIRDAVVNLPLGEPRPNSNGMPPLACPIDSNMRQILKSFTIARAKAQFDALYVEDLLNSCIDRLKVCLDLRDRAQELEIRATSAAIDIDFQQKVLTETVKYDSAFYSVAPSLNQNGAGFRLHSPDWLPISVAPDKWAELSGARVNQNKAAQDTLDVRKAKLGEHGNASNFHERFEFIESLFRIHVAEAYSRALVCQEGLSEIYGINTQLPEKASDNFLDELVLWGQSASDDLDREIDSRVVVEMALAVSAPDANVTSFSLLGRPTYTGQLAGSRISFTVTEAPFTEMGLRDPRLRSFKVQSRPSTAPVFSRVWPLRVALPVSSIGSGSTTGVGALAFDQFRDFDTGQSVVRGVHNRSPIGAWEFFLQPKALDGTGSDINALSNIFLFLRVSCRKL